MDRVEKCDIDNPSQIVILLTFENHGYQEEHYFVTKKLVGMDISMTIHKIGICCICIGLLGR